MSGAIHAGTAIPRDQPARRNGVLVWRARADASPHRPAASAVLAVAMVVTKTTAADPRPKLLSQIRGTDREAAATWRPAGTRAPYWPSAVLSARSPRDRVPSRGGIRPPTGHAARPPADRAPRTAASTVPPTGARTPRLPYLALLGRWLCPDKDSQSSVCMLAPPLGPPAAPCAVVAPLRPPVLCAQLHLEPPMTSRHKGI